ncbi:unnamed protein product [Bemisia tabaci]|uniref:Glycolipid transfer protein domain-containing protein n=1 Tax=Bemisia tabaci TaxID=7038 RepID=A0A9P0EYR1_BEMTA|nr:PREDICTED: pleckstrin homology domain-containing family A member 8 [Bemisia tabaci]CAH0380985.1 unnamed protein product [Bemisia tabaci]
MESLESETITEEIVTFFTTQPVFPQVIDGTIDTKNFLDASRSVVELIERLGKGFAFVKHDVQGNIEKLNKKYLMDPKNFQSLTEMINLEHADGGKVSRDALLWLKRALNFVEVFLGFLIEDFHKNNNEDIIVILKKAYNTTLRQHHGWITQKLFLVVVRTCPTKNQMYSLLALGNDKVDPKCIIQGMEAFVNSLSLNLTVINQFYSDNNFES